MDLVRYYIPFSSISYQVNKRFFNQYYFLRRSFPTIVTFYGNFKRSGNILSCTYVDSTKRLFTTKTSPEVDENTSKVRKTSRKTFVMCSNDIEVDKSNRSNNTVKSY